MFPRLSDAQIRELPGSGSASRRQRDAMTKLARRRRAPGLLAFEDAEPVGWIAGTARTGDDNAFFGTEPLFRRAGFRVVREPLEGLPRNWVPRVTMRIEAPHRERTRTMPR